MIPAVLSTSECYDYVGGRPIFEELQSLYGSVLKPLRTTPRGDQTWLRETVESVLRTAYSEGSLSDRPRVEQPSASGDNAARQPGHHDRQARRDAFHRTASTSAEFGVNPT